MTSALLIARLLVNLAGVGINVFLIDWSVRSFGFALEGGTSTMRLQAGSVLFRGLSRLFAHSGLAFLEVCVLTGVTETHHSPIWQGLGMVGAYSFLALDSLVDLFTRWRIRRSI